MRALLACACALLIGCSPRLIGPWTPVDDSCIIVLPPGTVFETPLSGGYELNGFAVLCPEEYFTLMVKMLETLTDQANEQYGPMDGLADGEDM